MSSEQEYIGKVKLNYTWYPGEDLYSDGEVEKHLLEIVEQYPESEYNEVIAREKSWPVLYHLSHIRENIVDAVRISPDEDVLEIGSGCGAVTGSLARRAKSVTCIDLSRMRSRINATRHADLDNLEIIVGNFLEIEQHLERKFDCITLIGVFEYGAAFMGEKDPYGSFLRLIAKHLKKGGSLVIAIENRLGLKYWAGAREDHTGGYFDGLEDYAKGQDVRTFSRPELEKILGENGYASRRFYYPYPDYKLPVSIYSDRYLPAEGDLNSNIWNFDRDRLVLFDEGKVYDSLIRSGLYDQFANSFLVIAQTEESYTRTGVRPVYLKYSNDRSRKYSVRTEITEDDTRHRQVCKSACYPEGLEHVTKTARHCLQLTELFQDTRLKVNRAQQSGDQLHLEYLRHTKTLSDLAGDAWRAGDRKEARRILRSLCSLITEHATEPFEFTPAFGELFGLESFPYSDMSMPVTDLDMIADNVMVGDDGSWNLIDYEWTVEFPVPVRFVTFRIWHYFHAFFAIDYNQKTFMEDAGYTWPEALLYIRMEEAWQNRVSGEHHPLRTMFATITPGASVPKEIRHAERNSANPEGTAYFGLKLSKAEQEEADAADTADGASPTKEKTVRGIMMKMSRENFEVSLTTRKIGAVTYIRWDPLSEQMCRIRIDTVISPVLVKITPLNGFRRDGWDEFWSLDPAYLIEGDIPENSTITIRGQLQTIPVSLMLPQMDHERASLTAQLKAMTDEANRLRGELEATRSTKAYRGTEKLRRARNYVMARVRALPPLRKPEEVLPPQGDLQYQKWFKEHSATEQELDMQRALTMPVRPKISILVPVWNTPERFLRDMIESVQAQTYTNWELCIADASVEKDQKTGKLRRNKEVLRILKEYAGADERVRYCLLKKNGGISENTNAAARMATGDYIALLDHDDILAPDALFEVTGAISLHDPDVIYTDEDKINMEATFHFDPNLKPDFSPELLCSHNYITHFYVVRKTLLDRTGYFRKEFDGAQDYDLILRTTEQAERIVHIPKILYYWRNHPNSTSLNPENKLYAYDAGTKAIAAHLERMHIPGTVEQMDLWGMNHVHYGTPGDPLISVIIPNKDHADDLKLCIESILEKSSYRNLEFIVVENNSVDPATFAYYEELQNQHPEVRVVRWEREFNYSAINNFGVSFAKGDYLLLLNNDTELLEPDSLKEMLGICMMKEIGCVGAKLLFADDTVQHCGIILGPGGFAGHVFSGIKDTDYGFMVRARITGNWSAVTAACLMVRREVYEEVGGLSEDYAVALNDVDFCMKIRDKNYRIVCTPFAKWHHFESKSRGYEDTPEKMERFQREVKRFRSRWGRVVDAGDPYYNKNLSVDRLPFSLW